MPEKLEFQPKGYFYDMVNTYNTAICGLILFAPNLKNLVSQLKPAGLASREYSALAIRPQEISSLIDRNFINLGNVTDNLSYMLLNIAYEAVEGLLKTVKNVDITKTDPMHEFFRHLRNGASHGGIWTFDDRDKRPLPDAVWRGRKVDKNTLKGEKICTLNLGPGDIMVLLWDIEQSLK